MTVQQASGFEPEAARLRRNLRSLIDKISTHKGLSHRSFLTTHLRTQAPLDVYNPVIPRIDAYRYDRWLQMISDVWPDDEGLDWPSDIIRPPASSTAKEAV